MARDVVVRPTGTSWGAILDGWLATVGVAAILTPIVGVLLTSLYATRGYASTVPILAAVAISYLVGGYVAGRMAGYRTSWHGMLTAFFSLFVLLVIVLVSYAASRGAFSGIGLNNLTDLAPGAAGLNVDSLGNALTFGALL